MILDTLKQRLHTSLVRPFPAEADLAAARRLAEAVDGDGSWPDVDYSGGDRFAWPAVRHLERTLVLARTRQPDSGELDAALTRALDFWLSRDLQAPHRWHHQIGVPHLVGSAAFLFESGLSAGARGKVVEILARARWARWEGGGWTDWSGANLLWIAFNGLLRGCVENVPALCQEACERAFKEIRIAPVGEEGLQADMSFHQRGARLDSGGDGLAFAENAVQFVLLTHGTPWQAPPECLRTLAVFLLDGQQWMIRAGGFDDSAAEHGVGRGVGDLRRFAAAVEQLADGGVTPRRNEMATFARRLRSAAEPALTGHRHYWRSDFAVHQRPAYYTSLRMSSRRTATAGQGVPRKTPPRALRPTA